MVAERTAGICDAEESVHIHWKTFRKLIMYVTQEFISLSMQKKINFEHLGCEYFETGIVKQMST